MMTHEVYNADNIDFLDHWGNSDNGKESIDLCYIDPPYNTGNSAKTFVYHDCFKKTGTQTRHQVWLDFMRPRLEKTLPLLKRTGVVAVSIDDSEVHHLRILMDEIFGENNFIAQIVVDGGNVKNNARFVSTTHEYLLVYAKSQIALTKSGAKWRQQREGLAVLRKQEKVLRKKHGEDYPALTADLKLWVKTAPLSKRLKVFYNADANGLYTYADLSAPGNGGRYDVLHPESWNTVQVPSRGWGLSEDKMQKLIMDGLVIFGEGPDGHLKQPMKKLYLKDSKDQVIRSILAYPARSSTHLLEHILGKRNAFNNPKNLDMMKFIVDSMCPPDGTVLDYFAGSGSTGHAVLELNATENSNRTFVLCTNNENGIYDNVTKPRLDAVLSGKWMNGKTNKPKDEVIEYRVLKGKAKK